MSHATSSQTAPAGARRPDDAVLPVGAVDVASAGSSTGPSGSGWPAPAAASGGTVTSGPVRAPSDGTGTGGAGPVAVGSGVTASDGSAVSGAAPVAVSALPGGAHGACCTRRDEGPGVLLLCAACRRAGGGHGLDVRALERRSNDLEQRRAQPQPALDLDAGELAWPGAAVDPHHQRAPARPHVRGREPVAAPGWESRAPSTGSGTATAHGCGSVRQTAASLSQRSHTVPSGGTRSRALRGWPWWDTSCARTTPLTTPLPV